MNLISKMLSFGEGRKLKKYEATVAKVNAIEPAMQALSDEELSALTAAFRERHAAGESLDALLPEAFAAVPKVIEDAAKAVVANSCPKHGAWNIQAVEKWAAEMTGQRTFKVANVRHEGDPAKLANALAKYLKALYANKESQLSAPIMQAVAAQVMMRSIDARWMSHLRDMDALKTGITLRAIGHRDPKLEYKEEAHKAFATLTQSMYEDYLQALLRGQLAIKLKAGELALDAG